MDFFLHLMISLPKEARLALIDPETDNLNGILSNIWSNFLLEFKSFQVHLKFNLNIDSQLDLDSQPDIDIQLAFRLTINEGEWGKT